MDGHNIIFRIGALERLQVSNRGGEARALLEESLRDFAQRGGERVLVVFDGNDQPSGPDARKTPAFETVYARRAGGVVADDRILQEADRSLKRGFLVTVVTDDVSTLAVLLSREVRRLGVREFWRRHIEPPSDPDDKPVGGDFSEIERALLAHAAATEAPPSRGASDQAVPGRAIVNPAAPHGTSHERVDRKRERGRLRQERLLRRRAKPGSRGRGSAA